MYQHLHIVALRTVRHSDRSSVLTAYSLERGRVAFAVPAGAGREAARRRALLMPLSVVECVASSAPGRELMTMREPRAVSPAHLIHVDPKRAAVALFICDVLQAALREVQPDPALFAYVTGTAGALADASVGVANFSIAFLVGLARVLGIEPDYSSWRPGRVMDLLDGTFRPTAPLHAFRLSAAESSVAAMLGRMTFGNQSRFRFSRAERREVIDGILRYFSLHHARLTALRSPEVLTALFS